MRQIDVAHLVEAVHVGAEHEAGEGHVIELGGHAGGAGEIGFDGIEEGGAEVAGDGEA